MTFDTVLFDVDGTLIHSAPGILASLRYAFEKMGIDPDTIDLMRYLGPPLRNSFAHHFSGEEDIERAVQLYREHYETGGQRDCSLYPGVETMLETLRAKGLLLCTATCKPKAVVEPILAEQGLLKYFDIVGGASMDSSVDNKAAVIRQVLADDRLQGKHALMVGDRGEDLRGAQANGLPCCGVLYGYGSREELEACRPEYFAASVEELQALILK